MKTLAELLEAYEELQALKIKLALWDATFQKYESWQANRVPSNMWPAEVLKDYRKLREHK